MAQGDWLELRHNGESLFVVGATAREYWTTSGADDSLESRGERGGPQILGRYLISRQLGTAPELDLRDDDAVLRVLNRAGLTTQDAVGLLRQIDAAFATADFETLIAVLHENHLKLTKPPAKGFLLDLALARRAAQQLPPEHVEYSSLSTDTQEEHSSAAASKYIRELGTVYAKLRQRLDKLEALLLHDPALYEATRAYLYGFTRSAVLLSAAALEGALVAYFTLSGTSDSEEKLWALLTRAQDSAVFSHEERRAGDWLRRLRNRVAHEGYEPKPEEGADALFQCRRLMVRLADRGTGNRGEQG